MFTGIVKELGKVEKIQKGKNFWTFVVKAKKAHRGLKIGDSIAVNGACMTITKRTSDSFTFDVTEESLKKTNLSLLKKDEAINLEPALKMGDFIGGHFAQGHVDTMGEINSIDKNALTINFPKTLAPHIAYKGSISVNGISLTIAKENGKSFTAFLIPETLKKTNLKFLKKGDKVNLEIDLISRYLWKLTKSQKAR